MTGRRALWHATAGALLLSGCGGGDGGEGGAREAAGATPAATVAAAGAQPACTAAEARAQLRQAVFDKARALTPDQAALLDRLAGAARMRVAAPTVRGSDPALAVTLCRARVTVDLPDGVIDAFGGGSRLAATLDYAVQQGRGSGPAVHPLRGADPIVYRLAAIALAEGARRDAAAAATAGRPDAPRLATRTRGAAPAASGAGAAETARAPAAPRRQTASVPRPTFDCRRPRSRADSIVCGDRWLATLDRETDDRFRRALAASDADDRKRLHRTQARFLGRMERCTRRHCVEDVYQDRMKQIARILR